MKIKVLKREQLECILYTYINQNPECVIDLFDEKLHKSFYVSSKKLSDDTVLLNLTAGDISTGKAIHIRNNESKMEWIKKICDMIDWKYADLMANLQSKIDDEPSSGIISYSNRLVKAVDGNRTKVINTNELIILFLNFLLKDESDIMIVTFVPHIPTIKSFKIKCIIDKSSYIDGSLIHIKIRKTGEGIDDDDDDFNTFFIFNYERDDLRICKPDEQNIYSYNKNDPIEHIINIVSKFKEFMEYCYMNSIDLSEDVNIYVQSN